jgi:hypothetical protein
MMSAIRAMAVPATAGAPLKASTAAISSASVTVASAIGASIRASAASAEPSTVAAAVASTALGALESRTGIGANARKILARRAGIARGTGFAREQNNVVLHDSFHRGAIRGCRGNGLRFNVLDGFVVGEIGALRFRQFRAVSFLVVFTIFIAVLRSFAGFGGELRFVRFHFRFSVLALFPLFLFFLRFMLHLMSVVGMLFMLGNFVRFVKRFRLVFVELGATDERVGFGARLGFLMLCFHKASGE